MIIPSLSQDQILLFFEKYHSHQIKYHLTSAFENWLEKEVKIMSFRDENEYYLEVILQSFLT